MRNRASCQTANVVSPFQNTDESPTADSTSHTHDLNGHKRIIEFGELKERLLLVAMCIKPRTHENQIRLKHQKPGNPNIVDNLEHICPVAAFRHRRIDDIARLSRLQSERKCCFLIETEKRYAIVSLDDIFRPVSPMHVEINNCHALEPQYVQGMKRRTGHGVDQTKAVRKITSRMVSGRTYTSKGISNGSGTDLSYRLNGGAGTFECGFKTQGIDESVFGNLLFTGSLRLSASLFQFLHITLVVRSQHIFH